MKKIQLVLITLLIGSSSMASLNWYWDADGVMGSGYEQGWLVYMYQDVDGASDLSSLVIYNDGSASQGDAFTTFSTAIQDPAPNGYFELFNIITPGAFNAYTVIFNSATLGGASQYVIAESSSVLLPNTDGVNNGDYEVLSINGSWKNIQAIPEPTTVLLFGIGGVGAWLVRRQRKV